MKISNNIEFISSHQLCFLKPLFRLSAQGRRMAMLERIQLVIVWLHNSLSDSANGLSSILDLVDSSELSQKSLFTKEHWSFLKSLFKAEVIAEPQPVPIVLSNTWLIISKSIMNSKNISIEIDYIYKITAKKSRENRPCLKIFEHVLNLVDRYSHLLVKSNGEGNDYSENDILRIIWSPILEQLFPPKEHHITVKTGETINVISQEHKEDLYNNSSNIKAFKIDIRAIFKNNGKQVDIVSGEIARNNEDMKIISDEGKLNRETKDALDSMLSLVDKPIQAFGMQISMLSSQSLTRNGLYVYQPMFDFSLPSCINELDSFIEVFQKMYNFQQYVIATANALEKATNKKQSMEETFGQYGLKDNNPCSLLHWRRDTYYTPPKNKVGKIPLHMFGSPSTSSTPSSITSLSSQKRDDSGDKDIQYDVYGWGERNGKWYNNVTGEVQDESPYAD